MSKVYVLRNQRGQYATRKGEWISGRETTAVAHFIHFDQALNQLFELGIKDIYLRGRVDDLQLNESGKLIVTDFGPEPELPAPIADPSHAESTPIIQSATEPA